MIKIRKHNRDDIKYRTEWLNNPNVNRYIGNNIGEGTTLAKQEQWFNEYEKSDDKEFFTICDENQPIGWMGLSNINQTNKNADLFLAIGEDSHRGKGVGKIAIKWLIAHAFDELELHKINLGVVESNTAAINLYKSMGFETEGVMKDEICHNGKFANFLSMAIFNIE